MTNDHSRHSCAVWLIAAVLLLPIAYVLSLGPFLWLYAHGFLSPPVADQISIPYFPLRWLADNNATCRDLLDWYIHLWR